MAIGQKTGGRDFKKGEGGRPKGAKDRLPRSAKQAVAGLLEKLGSDVELIESVLKKGLAARAPSSFPYLRLLVEQNVGAPDQNVNTKTTVVHKHEPGSPRVA